MPVNRTKTEQEAFCAAWKQSGMSKVGFCKQNNISKSVLYKWLNKFGDNNKTSEVANKNDIQATAVKFLRINGVVNADKVLPVTGSTLEITIPNGIGIKLNLSQNNFNIFLQELLKWK